MIGKEARVKERCAMLVQILSAVREGAVIDKRFFNVSFVGRQAV